MICTVFKFVTKQYTHYLPEYKGRIFLGVVGYIGDHYGSSLNGQ